MFVGAGVDVLPAGGGGEVEGNLAGRLKSEQAGRQDDVPAAMVGCVAGREATLIVSSVSDSVSRSCLLAAVSVILVMFRCEKPPQK